MSENDQQCSQKDAKVLGFEWKDMKTLYSDPISFEKEKGNYQEFIYFYKSEVRQECGL